MWLVDGYRSQVHAVWSSVQCAYACKLNCVKVNNFCGQIQQKRSTLLSYVIATFLAEFSLFSGLTLLVWRQEGHPACRKLGVGLLVMTIWLELCTTNSCSCQHSPPPSSLIQWSPEWTRSGTSLPWSSWEMTAKQVFVLYLKFCVTFC